MRLGLAILTVLMVSGCGTPSNNVKVWNPATWFSGSEGRSVDNKTAKEEKARHEAVQAAQESAYAASVALSKAPASLPVAKAADFNATTTTLLDQAEGPLSLERKTKVAAIAEKVVSENPEVRKQGEKELAKKNDEFEAVSARFAKAEAASEAANSKLRAAFDRENAMANELRNQRLMFWAAVGLAVILAAGWVYVKIALGGVPVALGRALSDIRVRHPQVADAITPILDQYLNRNEQSLVAKHSR